MKGKVLSPDEFVNEMRVDDRLVARANLMADQLEALGFGEAIAIFRGGLPVDGSVLPVRSYASLRADPELDARIEAIISRRVETLRDLAHVHEERVVKIERRLDTFGRRQAEDSAQLDRHNTLLGNDSARLEHQRARLDAHMKMIDTISASFQSEAAVIRIVKTEIDRFRQRTNEALKSGDGKLCDALNEFHERLSRLEGTAKS